MLRATLVLIPSTPAIGAPGDTTEFIAFQVAADFGAKSPVAQADTSGRPGRLIVTGRADTLRFDITGIVRAWRSDPLRPRAIELRPLVEPGLGEVRFLSTRSLTGQPVLELTFARADQVARP